MKYSLPVGEYFYFLSLWYNLNKVKGVKWHGYRNQVVTMGHGELFLTNTLTARGNGHSNGSWWFGFNAKVGSAPLDVMTLAVNGVTAQWWRDQLTSDISNIDNWGAATIKGLANGFDPDLIIIALGANDLDNPAIINNVGANLTEIISQWRTLQPNADMTLQTYWQPDWGVVRNQVLETASSQNVALLDFWPKIPPYSQHAGLYFDQYHFNDYGQRLFADIALQQLGIPQV